MQFEHVHFVLQAATDGLGFAAAPVSLVSSGIVSGQLRCLFPELTMPALRYYYGVAPDAVPEAQVFETWLEEELAKQL